MGYSYKNTKQKASSKNCPQIKEMRKKYATTITFLREHEHNEIYYIDEYVFA